MTMFDSDDDNDGNDDKATATPATATAMAAAMPTARDTVITHTSRLHDYAAGHVVVKF